MTHDTTMPIVGVSSCLLGNHVRYDGGHRHSIVITDTLHRFFNLFPVCPEVECGLPVPREAMRLEGDPADPRLMTIESRIDMTGRMEAFCREKLAELERLQLCGFILKKGSPSCGVSGIGIHQDNVPAGRGSGLFAAALNRRFPMLPVEEEDRLDNPVIREDFIARAASYHRTRDEQCSRLDVTGQ